MCLFWHVHHNLERGVSMAPQRKSVVRPSLVALLVAVLATIGLVQVAQANGGSDGPTPYTVDVNGITLPSGDVFMDNGHVNIRTATGKTAGVHLEGKCINRSDAECAGARHEQAQFIGKGFIPWSAFGINTATECVVWVQVSHYNQHFGEGGQDPVGKCKGSETPKPTDPVEPCPTTTVTATATATATETVTVPGPTATATATTTVTVQPTAAPTSTVTTTVTPAPAPTVTVTRTLTPTPGPTVFKTVEAKRPGLPHTGN